MNISPESFTPQYRQHKAVTELTDRFNRGDLDYLPKRDLENVAMLAAQFGTDLTPKSKPVRKALFDFADTMALGMIPNKWRPKSIGEEFFGESSVDKTFGNIGTGLGVGGSLLGGTALVRGINSLWKARKGVEPLMLTAGARSTPAAERGSQMLRLNSGRDRLLGPGQDRLPLPNTAIGGRPNLLQLGAPSFASTPGMLETVDIFSRGGRSLY